MSATPIQIICPHCNANNILQSGIEQFACQNCKHVVVVATLGKRQVITEPVASNVDESGVFPPLPNSALANEIANPAAPTGPVEQLNYPPGMAPPGSEPTIVNPAPQQATPPNPVAAQPQIPQQPVAASPNVAPILPPGVAPTSVPAPVAPGPISNNPAGIQLPSGAATPASVPPQVGPQGMPQVTPGGAPQISAQAAPSFSPQGSQQRPQFGTAPSKQDPDGQPESNKPDAKAIGMIAGIVGLGLVIIIAGVLGIKILSKLGNQPKQTFANAALETFNDPDIPWALAGKQTSKIGNVSVKVDLVKYDEIRGKDAAHRVQDSKGENFLQIHMELRNRGKSINYTSWYSEQFDVVLVDETGERFDLMLFEDVVKIQGQARESGMLEKNERLDDVLAFDMPAGKTLDDMEMLYLTLPGQALGGKSNVYFKIDPKTITKAGDAPSSGLPKSPIMLDE